jgi:hypothetical protein
MTEVTVAATVVVFWRLMEALLSFGMLVQLFSVCSNYQTMKFLRDSVLQDN